MDYPFFVPDWPIRKKVTEKYPDLKIINEQDSLVSNSIYNELASIERFISDLVVCLLNGGRLIYIGSGTSGRLGVLDASECHPTFQTSKNLIVGVIAVGEKAISEEVESKLNSPLVDVVNVTVLPSPVY